MQNQQWITPGQFLLPKENIPFSTWACIACDQYTHSKSYWQNVAQFVGTNPSTLNLMLPEVNLDNEDKLIPVVQENMKKYLADNIFNTYDSSYILVERNTPAGARLGLVCLVDLEAYSIVKDTPSPVRPTEDIVVSRLPARTKIRKNATLELSHVLMLMDDVAHSVIEPIYAKKDTLTKVYDFPLMFNGGHLVGYVVNDPADIASIDQAIYALGQQKNNDFVFAVGDGNHSLAAAKAYWEECKSTLSSAELANHPARYAMVELENIHDDALIFEPIHRVLMGFDGDDLLNELALYSSKHGINLTEQGITCIYEGKAVEFNLHQDGDTMPVEGLQRFLDEFVAKHPNCTLDYIHGDEEVKKLSQNPKTIGFLLPALDKSTFFERLVDKGTMPRKTFSLGHATDKRYYMECRKL